MTLGALRGWHAARKMKRSMRVLLLSATLLAACSADDRAPPASGEHPAGMTAPPVVLGQGAAAPAGGAARTGHVRLIPSLMRAPDMGEAAPDDTVLSFDGTIIPVRDGAFDPGGRAGWFTLTRGAVRVLARVEPTAGALTLPLLRDRAPGMPRGDRASVVLQVLDSAGSPILGVIGAPRPGVVGPCYDNNGDAMDDKLPSTGSRGSIAYLEVDPRAGATFTTELTLASGGGTPVVAAVPVVAGTVTLLRATLR